MYGDISSFDKNITFLNDSSHVTLSHLFGEQMLSNCPVLIEMKERRRTKLQMRLLAMSLDFLLIHNS